MDATGAVALPLPRTMVQEFLCTNMPFRRVLLLAAALLLPATASAVERPGRAEYDYYCYQCHGYAGNARTAASRYLSPRPRDFTSTPKDKLSRAAMVDAVRNGRPGTAMMPFSRVLSAQRIEAVVDYVRAELLGTAARALRYHTASNGWRDHDRYFTAFAFAQGTLSVDSPWDSLTPAQREGKRLFLSACITCHDGRPSGYDPVVWEPRAVSFPRSVDTCLDCHASRPAELLPPSRAVVHVPDQKFSRGSTPESPYTVHARFDRRTNLNAAEERGRRNFLASCAYCHAADGSGRNWIGSFIEPRPRDLQQWMSRNVVDPSRLRRVIRYGIPGTSMPGWRSVLTDRQIEDTVAFLRRSFGTAAHRPSFATTPGNPAGSPVQWIRSAPAP